MIFLTSCGLQTSSFQSSLMESEVLLRLMLTELLFLKPGSPGSGQLLEVQMALGDWHPNPLIALGSQARISRSHLAIWNSRLETWGCQVMRGQILANAR